MAAQSEPSARMLGDEPSGSRLVPTRHPEQGAGNGASKVCSAKVNADERLMEQFIQNLLRALSAWPT
jgi:hypothetical protein